MEHQINVTVSIGLAVISFKNLCQSLSGKTAWDFMLEVLNDKMYDCVAI